MLRFIKVIRDNDKLIFGGLIVFCLTPIVGTVIAYKPFGAVIFVGLIIVILIAFRPILGLLFFIPLDIYLDSYYLGPIPIRYYPLIVMVVILVGNLAIYRKSGLNRIASRMLIVASIYVFWVFARELTYRPLVEVIPWVIGRIMAGIVLAVCLALFAKRGNQLMALFYFILSLVTVSAFVGLMQLLDIPYFQELKNIVLRSSSEKALYIPQSVSTGLVFYTTTQAYMISFILPITFAFFLGTKRQELKFLLGLCCVILFVGLVASRLMSGILGTILSLSLVIWLWSGKKFPWKPALIIVIMLFLSQYLVPRIFITRLIEDSDTLERIPLGLVAIRTALVNPLGTGRGSGYASEVVLGVNALAHIPGIDVALYKAPHNNFISVWSFFGLPGIVCYLAFYIMLWQGMLKLWRRVNETKDLSLKVWVIGLTGAFLVSLLNSLTHNAGLFLGEEIGWYGVGILWVLSNQLNNQFNE